MSEKKREKKIGQITKKHLFLNPGHQRDWKLERRRPRSVLKFLNNLWESRNRVGIGLSYRPARLHRLAELMPWNRFLVSINV
jgi:hypothetical protein